MACQAHCVVSWRTWHSWGWSRGGLGVAGGAAGPCWLLGTLTAILGLQGQVFQVWRALQFKVFHWQSCCLQHWVIKVVQKWLIRFEDTKYSADTKYDCDYCLALEESFP